MIGFDSSSYNILEMERVVNVTIVLTGMTDISITVVLDTQDGTAICEYKINVKISTKLPLSNILVLQRTYMHIITKKGTYL